MVCRARYAGDPFVPPSVHEGARYASIEVWKRPMTRVANTYASASAIAGAELAQKFAGTQVFDVGFGRWVSGVPGTWTSLHPLIGRLKRILVGGRRRPVFPMLARSALQMYFVRAVAQ